MDGMDRKIENKAKKRRRIAWISLSGIIFLLIISYIIFGDKSSKLNVEMDKISIGEVQYDYFKDYIAVIGTVEPIKTIYLDATEGGSRVEEIIIEEGNMVKKGDLILKLSNTNLILDISNYEAQVARTTNELRQARLLMEQQTLNSKSQLLEVEYNLKKQERVFHNNETLFKENHISAEEYKYSKEQYELLEKKVALLRENLRQDSLYRTVQIGNLENSARRMQNNLELVQKRLESLNFSAPVSGELASLNLEVGQVISTGQRIGQINILDSYKLRVDIDEFYIAKISKGLVGEFEFAGKKYKVKIVKIYPEVQNGRFAVDMEFVSDIPDQIKIGQTSRISLELGKPRKALLLARGGFYQSTGGQWVYILNGSEEFAVKRTISIGSQNPRYYEVLDGLKEGEKVIISSYDNFGDVDKLILK